MLFKLWAKREQLTELQLKYILTQVHSPLGNQIPFILFGIVRKIVNYFHKIRTFKL